MEGSDRFDCYEAAYKGALPRLKSLVDNNFKANKRDVSGACPLHFAAQGGRADCVSFLLEIGAEVNWQDLKGHSPLHKAALAGEIECARLLVDHGADVNLVDRTGASPLHYAALFGEKKTQQNEKEEKEKEKAKDKENTSVSMAELFLLRGAYVDIRSDGGQFPLHYASIAGNADAVRALIAHGAAVNATDFEGATALHRAAAVSGECTELLLNNGAIANVKDIDEATPLHHAAEGGCLSSISLLVQKGKIHVDARDSQDATPLLSAAFHGHLESLKRLMELGASPLLVDAKGNTPLHNVAFNGHDSCIEFLMTYGKKQCAEYIHLQDSTGATALHKAAFKGRAKTAGSLLQHGASLTLPDREGSHPFHKAAFNGHADCLKFLIEAKNNPLPNSLKVTPKPSARKDPKARAPAAKVVISDVFDINAGDKHLSTALHKAALRGHVACVSVLLDKGADYKAKDKLGGTPLHNAVQGVSLECMEALLRKEEEAHYAKLGIKPPEPAKEKDNKGNKAKGSQKEKEKEAPVVALEGANTPDYNGYTPMHVASCVGSVACTKILLQKGAKVDEKNKSGRTPLFYAINSGHEEMARLLIIDARADVDIKDGKTDRALIDLQQHDARALSSEIILALVHERDNPIAERLMIETLTPEQRKIYQQVIELFNTKPKKGIELLVKEKLVTDTPPSLAHFLFTTAQLNQEQVGDFISANDQYCSAILQAYVQLYDFKHLDFDMAIRRFVASSFKMPKESQQIERVMQAFAKRYYTANPHSVFANEDAAFVLAYSSIMLNTDAHTSAVVKKMTLEEFMNQNRGINGGKDIPKEFMVHLYSRITEDEIKMKSGLDKYSPWANADKQGYLYKQTGKRKVWSNRWFVLKDSSMYYFKKKTDARPCGMIPIDDLVVGAMEDRSKKKYQYQLRLKNKIPGQRVKSNQYTGKSNNNVKPGYVEMVVLAAPSKAEHTSWLSILRRNIRKFAKLAAANAKRAQAKQRSSRQLKPKHGSRKPSSKKAPSSLGKTSGAKAAAAPAKEPSGGSKRASPVPDRASTLRPRTPTENSGKAVPSTARESRPKRRSQTIKTPPVPPIPIEAVEPKTKSPRHLTPKERPTAKEKAKHAETVGRVSSSKLPRVDETQSGEAAPPALESPKHKGV